jgi:hypothetical protein
MKEGCLLDFGERAIEVVGRDADVGLVQWYAVVLYCRRRFPCDIVILSRGVYVTAILATPVAIRIHIDLVSSPAMRPSFVHTAGGNALQIPRHRGASRKTEKA